MKIKSEAEKSQEKRDTPSTFASRFRTHETKVIDKEATKEIADPIIKDVITKKSIMLPTAGVPSEIYGRNEPVCIIDQRT